MTLACLLETALDAGVVIDACAGRGRCWAGLVRRRVVDEAAEAAAGAGALALLLLLVGLYEAGLARIGAEPAIAIARVGEAGIAGSADAHDQSLRRNALQR